MPCRWLHILPTSFARGPRYFQISAYSKGYCGGTNVIPAYRTSTQIFVLRIARSMECSDTKTHLLPAVLLALISGVNAAISSSSIKFEPLPNLIWLKATHKMVYHMTQFTIA